MRLIDADALIPLIQEDKIEGETLDIIKALGDGLQAETLNQACDRHINIINSLPTIKAEPIKHGRWIEVSDSSGYVGEPCEACSVCGMQTDYPSNYCPNCGTDMREVEKNEQNMDTR